MHQLKLNPGEPEPEPEPWCWITTGGEDWRSREKTHLLEKNNVCILWYLETATSFRYCGFLWIRHRGPCVGPCVVILKLYVCVSSGDTSLLQNTRQLWTVSTLLITTGQCLYITWLFPQLSHSSSLVNIHFPQMEMLLRKTAQALDLLSGQAKLGTYGWSQCVCSGPLACTYCSAMILSHGARGSLHLRPCLEVLAAPEFQTHFKVGSVVMKPRATKGGLCFPKYLSP